MTNWPPACAAPPSTSRARSVTGAPASSASSTTAGNSPSPVSTPRPRPITPAPRSAPGSASSAGACASSAAKRSPQASLRRAASRSRPGCSPRTPRRGSPSRPGGSRCCRSRSAPACASTPIGASATRSTPPTPLLAVVTAWGPDRPVALGRLRRALARTAVVIEGGASNRTLLLDLLHRDEFARGAVDDRWLDRRARRGALVRRRRPVVLLAAAAEAYEADHALAKAAFFAAAARGRPERPADVGAGILLDLRRGRATAWMSIAWGRAITRSITAASARTSRSIIWMPASVESPAADVATGCSSPPRTPGFASRSDAWRPSRGSRRRRRRARRLAGISRGGPCSSPACGWPQVTRSRCSSR